MSTILITGGAGYIGSHIALLLYQQGHSIILFDALLHGQSWQHTWAECIQGNLADTSLLIKIFKNYTIDAVIHCAALIEVGASVKDPLSFYINNVNSTITLLNAMHRHNVNIFLFSSSCAVYGIPLYTPITEAHPKLPISPYGQSKSIIEDILPPIAQAYGIRSMALRYFNAAGTYPKSGLYEHHIPETHLIPLLLQAAYENKLFHIFGSDHATPDGTCIRDFLHVWDIAHAHAAALTYLMQVQPGFVDYCNLGTGTGVSVRQVIQAVQDYAGHTIMVTKGPKRPGDPSILIADASKAQKLLGWHPTMSSLEIIIETAQAGYLAHNLHKNV